MFRIALLKEHRTWEDYLSIFLGVLIGLTPHIAGETADAAVALNAMVVGTLVLVLASFELVHLHRSEEVEEFLCGGWLMASPFVFGYAGTGQLRWWHFSLGALVALLAALEFWQDRKQSAQELAKHGQ
jgi:hypothetical protein